MIRKILIIFLLFLFLGFLIPSLHFSFAQIPNLDQLDDSNQQQNTLPPNFNELPDFVQAEILKQQQNLGGLPEGSDDMPGITCGDADNPEANKCCSGKELKSFSGNIVPDKICLFGACVTDLINWPINFALNLFKVPQLLDMQKETNVSACVNGTPSNEGSNSCKCIPVKASARILCDNYLKGKPEYGKCVDCTEKQGGIWTGFECIKSDVRGFVTNTLLGTGLGLAGGAAFLCIIYAAFLMQTSQGNTEKLKKAREYLTNCIMGLLLIIFSIIILRLIGVEILRIPGFG